MNLKSISRGNVIRLVTGTHIALSITSILHATVFGKSQLSTSLSDVKKDEVDSERTKLYEQECKHPWIGELDSLVHSMYSGRGVPKYLQRPDPDSTSLLQFHHDEISFEDPIAICTTSDEVCEAFRALKFTKPVCLTLPKRIEMHPRENKIEKWLVTYHLNQRYFGFLTVHSLLVVDIALDQEQKQILEVNDNVSSPIIFPKARILKIEERWNGVSIFNIFPFWASRRLNGMASFMLTSWLLN